MKKQGVEFEEVYDLFAIRIILNSTPTKEKSDCWRAYSVVTDFYQPNPQRMRDWISIPKSNGYESLHTTVIGPDKKWVEVQIRSQRMDEIAEKGYAAHWKYKGLRSEQGIDQWMNKIRELIETTDDESPQDIDDLKLNLYNKEIFVFTPNGDLKKFPAGATVLDFAYDIHSRYWKPVCWCQNKQEKCYH
ncbi:MAG: TGS domain-containing protein [Rhodopseudomonas palustris]|nr:TGS domain-containing protein [Rhodopseudomonas palustris]